MLSSWNPNRIIKKIPFNIALCGGRRMGKSTAVADLVFRMRKEFQLMICFVGSAALSGLMERFWDDRFFFPAWNTEMMETLFKQQEDLKRKKVERKVCILVDDVVMPKTSSHIWRCGEDISTLVSSCAPSATPRSPNGCAGPLMFCSSTPAP